MKQKSQSRELAESVLLLLAFLFAVWCARQAIVYFRGSAPVQIQPRVSDSSGAPLQSVHYWTMAAAAPDDSVRIWLPEYVNHQTLCPTEKVSKALAVAMVLDVEETVNRHERHYHVRKDEEYGGFRVDEFVKDNDGLGEKWVGNSRLVHYHGVYVDEKTAQEFLSVLLEHQHGAKFGKN